MPPKAYISLAGEGSWPCFNSGATRLMEPATIPLSDTLCSYKKQIIIQKKSFLEWKKSRPGLLTFSCPPPKKIHEFAVVYYTYRCLCEIIVSNNPFLPADGKHVVGMQRCMSKRCCMKILETQSYALHHLPNLLCGNNKTEDKNKHLLHKKKSLQTVQGSTKIKILSVMPNNAWY